MRQAIILPVIILLASLAAADITVQPTMTTATTRAAAFTISGGEGIAITPGADYDLLIIFIDEKPHASYNNVKTGQTLMLGMSTGTYTIEARGLKTYDYLWEDYKILQNDAPIYLEYAKYDKDDEKMKFSLAGAAMVHPDHVDSTKTSFKEELNDYTATIDDEKRLTCYPKITTGEDLYFSCRTGGRYPHKLAVTATIGVTASATIDVNGPTTTTSPDDPSRPMTTISTEEGVAVSRASEEEIAVANNIELMNRLRQPSTPIPVTVFIIILFITIIALLYITSHHNYESKRAGTHHPTKKRK